MDCLGARGSDITTPRDVTSRFFLEEGAPGAPFSISLKAGIGAYEPTSASSLGSAQRWSPCGHFQGLRRRRGRSPQPSSASCSPVEPPQEGNGPCASSVTRVEPGNCHVPLIGRPSGSGAPEALPWLWLRTHLLTSTAAAVSRNPVDVPWERPPPNPPANHSGAIFVF